MVRIAVAPHGFDVAGLRRIFLKLFPQPVDVYGDGGVVAHRVEPPDLLVQRLPVEHRVGVDLRRRAAERLLISAFALIIIRVGWKKQRRAPAGAAKGDKKMKTVQCALTAVLCAALLTGCGARIGVAADRSAGSALVGDGCGERDLPGEPQRRGSGRGQRRRGDPRDRGDRRPLYPERGQDRNGSRSGSIRPRGKTRRTTENKIECGGSGFTLGAAAFFADEKPAAGGKTLRRAKSQKFDWNKKAEQFRRPSGAGRAPAGRRPARR